jgi:hypothetical protein
MDFHFDAEVFGYLQWASMDSNVRFRLGMTS